MKIESFILLSLFLVFSCHMTKDLTGKSFSYKSKKRTLEFVFDSDSTCRLINTFHCNDIDPKIKVLVTYCIYKRDGDKVFLRNVNCKTDTCEYGLYMEFPVQNSIECEFLNEDYRLQDAISPSYSTDYKKNGAYPLIDNDTLQILKNKIVFYKQNGVESVGFVFK